MVMEQMQKVMPLIIKDHKNSIIDVTLTNEKGFKKSIEQNQLWHLHRETGRLLPWGEDALTGISEHKSWFEAVIDKGKKEQTGYSGTPGRQTAVGAAPSNISGNNPDSILNALEDVIRQRRTEMPEGSYTTHLFESGPEKIRKKAGEEAVELILAADRGSIIYEAADLIYHMMVLLASENISIEEIMNELAKRTG